MSRLVPQPNGRFAVFSNNSDDLLMVNVTRDEVIRVECEEGARQARRHAERWVDGKMPGRRMWGIEEVLADIRRAHGEEYATHRERELRGPVPAAVLAPFKGALTDRGVIEVAAGAAFRSRPHGWETYLIRRHPSAVPAWSERWCYPGGKIEPGETPEEAIIREWREEVAGAITVGALLHVAIWCADHPVKGRIVYRVQTFLVELVSEPHVQPEGGQADCWLLADTATERGDMLPSVRPAAAAYLALQGFGALTG